MDAVVEPQAGFSVEPTGGGRRLSFVGDWTITRIATVEPLLAALQAKSDERLVYDLGGIGTMDTAGAWLLYRSMRDLRFNGARVSYAQATQAQEILLEQALVNDAPCVIAPPIDHSIMRQVEDVGAETIHVLGGLGNLLSFLGLVLLTAIRDLLRFRCKITPLFHHMEEVGLKAVPIVGLIAFLIGLVLAQQGAVQLKAFGAEVFVADLIGFSVLRELGILLTAIIVAGRSGSAFTAQIGSMVLHEEVDAMRTIGIDPVSTLVVPRMFALILMLPLLTFLADLMGLFGGGLLAWASLDITPATFIQRLREVVTVKDFAVGLIKAPFFAIVISVTGCFEGLRVSGGADSVGEHTTRSVVASIFLVIVLNAFMAVFFTTIDF